MFDSLMDEIRRVDRHIVDLKSKWQKSQQELILVERSISNVKALQFKAVSVLRDSEKQNEVANVNLRTIHENYCVFVEYIDETGKNNEFRAQSVKSSIDKLKSIRDNLKNKIIAAKIEKERVAQEVNEIDLQISIQKKKNAAMLLRLQKDLEKYLQEERNLKHELIKQ